MSGKSGTQVRSAWAAFWVILIGLGMAAGGGYLVYKYRLRVSMVLFYFLIFNLCHFWRSTSSLFHNAFIILYLIDYDATL